MNRTPNRPRPAASPAAKDLSGEIYEVEIGAVAHGGHCVARHEGQVLFVRHTAPGERVRARVTSGRVGDKFLRADAIEILSASPDRTPAPCEVSGPGGCGGCDWQHLNLVAQRRLKAEVIQEQFRRLAGLAVEVTVAALPLVEGADDGLGWRTRVRHAVMASGQLGLYAHRSHRVVPIASCPIATPAVQSIERAAPVWPGCTSVEVIAPAEGPPLVVLSAATRPTVPAKSALAASLVRQSPRGGERIRGRSWVSERVESGDRARDFRVTGSGFWQIHPAAAATLTRAVLAALNPQPGEQALDLYCGVGVFAAALAERVGAQGAVLAVESQPQAVQDARRNLHDLPQVGITQGRVEEVLATTIDVGLTADLVVLDPPREGAGRAVVAAIAAASPRAIAYVSCDPASLARDIKTFSELGYKLAHLQAFDCFPMTQHVECVATLTPDAAHERR